MSPAWTRWPSLLLGQQDDLRDGRAQCRQRGWGEEFGPGRYDLGSSIGNDRLSSLVVPAGYKVTLYADAGFSGKSMVLVENAASLASFNDRATSMVVEKMQSAPAPTLAELEQIIHQVAPRCYIHPDEGFGPSSVEWFLERATLKSSDGSSRPGSSGSLPQGGSSSRGPCSRSTSRSTAAVSGSPPETSSTTEGFLSCSRPGTGAPRTRVRR